MKSSVRTSLPKCGAWRDAVVGRMYLAPSSHPSMMVPLNTAVCVSLFCFPSICATNECAE